MDQVKRLYDTFHEPFKRVVSSHPDDPENPIHKDTGPSTVNEVTELENEEEDTNKRRKNEPELTVKSALSAAFAKYSEKFGKRNNEASGEKPGETSEELQSEAKKKKSNENNAC